MEYNVYRKHFRKNNIPVNVLLTLSIMLGLYGILVDWRSGLISILIIILLKIIDYSLFQIKFYHLIFLAWIIMLAISYFSNLEFMNMMVTTLLLSPVLIYSKILKVENKNPTIPIFTLNTDKLTCLDFEPKEYKSYALSPLSCLKTFSIKDIQAFSFRKKQAEFVIANHIIRPKELNQKEQVEIYNFIKANLPRLITEEQETMSKN